MEWLYSAFGNTKLNSVLAAADIRLESERKRIETAIATETETVTETMEAAVAMPPSRMVIGIATIARRTISPSETLASSAMLRKIEKGVRVANVVDAASRAKCRRTTTTDLHHDLHHHNFPLTTPHCRNPS